MAHFAIIENNEVVNLIIADSQKIANLFGHAVEWDYDQPAYIGWTYDGKNFIAPPKPKTIDSKTQA